MKKPPLLLRIETPYCVAGILFDKNQAQWLVIKTAPIFNWMRGKTAKEIKQILDQKKWKHQWIG